MVFLTDILLALPEQSDISPDKLHFLLYIPWDDKYLELVPEDFRSFYQDILPYLSARTTDVHTAICMQYLDEFINKASQAGKSVNRNVLAYALMLHDVGWSQMSDEEIASSLGVTGLALSDEAWVQRKNTLF